MHIDFRTSCCFSGDAKTPKVQSGTWAPFVASRRGVVLTSHKPRAIGTLGPVRDAVQPGFQETGWIVDSENP